MRENEVWKNDSEREFDNAVEGMEKLVMNRVFTLYVFLSFSLSSFPRFLFLLCSGGFCIFPQILKFHDTIFLLFFRTFVPALDPAQQATSQTDDLERDHVLSQRIKLFQWVNEEHLDLPQHKDTASFVEFAKQGEYSKPIPRGLFFGLNNS